MNCACTEFALAGAGSAGGAGSSPFRWTWSNATDRQAQSVSSSDVGRIGLQADMNLSYELTSASPTTWTSRPDPRFKLERKNLPIRNGTTFLDLGESLSLNNGTAVQRICAITTKSTLLARVTHQSAAAPASLAYRRHSTGLGLAAGRAGGNVAWRSTMAFVIGTTSATSRAFVGWGSTAFAADADPNTILNSLAVGRSSGEANLQLYRNGPSGTATKIDLGASFPFTSDAGYILEIYTGDGTTWAWQVTAVNTGVQVSGSSNDTKTPASTGTTTLLAQFFASSNADSVAVQVDVGDLITWQGL